MWTGSTTDMYALAALLFLFDVQAWRIGGQRQEVNGLKVLDRHELMPLGAGGYFYEHFVCADWWKV